jgi:hypothetical protein
MISPPSGPTFLALWSFEAGFQPEPLTDHVNAHGWTLASLMAMSSAVECP